MSDDKRNPDRPDDDLPRKGFFETIPRGTIARVVLLLAALVGIIVLQRKTGAIAGCMDQAFRAPAPVRREAGLERADAARIRARVVLPGEDAGASR